MLRKLSDDKDRDAVSPRQLMNFCALKLLRATSFNSCLKHLMKILSFCFHNVDLPEQFVNVIYEVRLVLTVVRKYVFCTITRLIIVKLLC